MMRWTIRAGGALLALVALAVVVIYIVIRASLPELDGSVAAAGIGGPATIERDAVGMPTITASNRADLAWATGYAHAQDRWFQMDLIRRRAAGELSALIGPATLDSDRNYRFHRFRARAERAFRALDPAHRAILDAYAAGANAGLGSLGAKPFEYYLLGAEPEAWQPEDSILVVYAMFMTLNDPRASRDVSRSYVHAVFPEEVYDWLYPDGTDLDAPIVGDARSPLPIPDPASLSLRTFDVEHDSDPEYVEPPIPGSNNWAVSGALTANGMALVSNDMHLGISVPNIYYQARLVESRESLTLRDVTGVTLPGSPFVVAGSTPHIAWGYTNSYGDWSDAVRVVPGSTADRYRTSAGERAFEEYVERIEIKGEAPVEYRIRETIWGPVDDRTAYPNGDVAVSWIAHHPEAVNINIMDLETAESLDAALDVANRMGIPPQNFVAGDSAGNIAWTIAGRIPRRGDFDPLLLADWSEADGWLGWLEVEDYPRVVNPPGGRIWTANSRVVDDGMLTVVGDGGYDRGARARQIRDGLLARQRFSPEDMLAIQTDDRALFLQRWQVLLVNVLENADGDPLLDEYLSLTRDWLPYAATESVGYRLVRSFRIEVQNRVWDALMAPVRAEYGDEVDLWRSPQFEGALWQLVSERPEHLLPQNYASWDVLLLDAVKASADYFQSRYETPLAERSWGERNTARIQHPLSLAVPALSGWLDMPRDPLPGDADLPRAQGPGFGASERFSVSPGDRENGLMHMPTGQSGHPMSPYYAQGHRDWVEGRPSAFLPGDAQHRLTFEPGE